jgi:hypothetical protein
VGDREQDLRRREPRRLGHGRFREQIAALVEGRLFFARLILARLIFAQFIFAQFIAQEAVVAAWSCFQPRTVERISLHFADRHALRRFDARAKLSKHLVTRTRLAQHLAEFFFSRQVVGTLHEKNRLTIRRPVQKQLAPVIFDQALDAGG